MSRPRIASFLLPALLLGALAARPALASCQTYFCHVEYCRYDLQQVEEIRRALAERQLSREMRERAESPAGSDLVRLVACEVRVAVYDSRMRWERQEALEIPYDALVARARAEQRRWLARLVEGSSQPGLLWCRLAEAQEGPETRLAVLRQGAGAHPADPALAACLGRELLAQQQPAGAEAYLRAYLDEHPEPQAYQVLGEALAARGARAERRALAEECARRRPQDVYSQVELLRFYEDQGLVAERDALLAALEERFPRPSERRPFCAALLRDKPAQLACAERLLAAGTAAGASLPGEERSSLASARNTILFAGIHAKSWPRIEEALAGWPEEDLLEPWSNLLNWLKQEACPRFLAGYRAGLFAAVLGGAEPWQVERMAYHLRTCGEVAEAERLLATALPALAEALLPVVPPEQGLPELRRRLDAEPQNASLHRALFQASYERPAEEQEAVLRRWAEQMPGELEPVLRLAALAEERGDGKAALGWWEEAVRRAPQDLDLLVRLGASALRFSEQGAARSAARRLLEAPAATPRQRAEARYLLGRLAQRAGRPAEAADHLAAYFLARLRHAGCFGTPEAQRGLTCDEPLVAYLLREGQARPLARYLAARAEAAAYHERHVEAAARKEWRPNPSPSPRLLAGPCVQAALERRLDEAGQAAEPGAAALAEALLRCPAAAAGAEPAFPDDELLALSARLTQRD